MNRKTAIKFAPVLAINFLEIFEFSLYGIFSNIFSYLFFNNSFGAIYSLGIFSIGFAARPIGGIVFGHIGDKYGMRLSLIFSIILMSLATLGIGVLPSYGQLGLTAPLILLVLRLLQGVSCGGEYIGVTIYLFEQLPKAPGLAGALAAISGIGGALLAILLSYFASLYAPNEWSWRIPFVLSAIFSSIILFLRMKYIPKTRSLRKIEKYPLKNVWARQFIGFLSIIFVGGCNGILTYILIVYLSLFLSAYSNLGFVTLLSFNFLAVCAFICSGFVFGIIKDRYQLPTLPCLLLICLLLSFFSHFLHLEMASKIYFRILASQVVLGILAGSFSAACNVFMSQQLPENLRYSGMALGYSLGVCLFGGTATSIYHLLIELTHNPNIASPYLILGSAFGLLGIFLSKATIQNKLIPAVSSLTKLKTVFKNAKRSLVHIELTHSLSPRNYYGYLVKSFKLKLKK